MGDGRDSRIRDGLGSGIEEVSIGKPVLGAWFVVEKQQHVTSNELRVIYRLWRSQSRWQHRVCHLMSSSARQGADLRLAGIGSGKTRRSCSSHYLCR